MDIDHLRSFTVLAQQLHFGRAAAVLHLSQPALTKQIRKLEGELGFALFARGPHGTALTTAGGQWLFHARDLVARFDQLVEHGRQSAAGDIGLLRIGYGSHTLDVVPPLVVALRAAAPGIRVTLHDLSTAEQAAGLRDGRLDLGFLRLPFARSADYEVLPVGTDRLAVVLPAAPPPRAGATLADFRDRPFVAISQERSPGFHQHTLELCAQHGFHPRIVQEVNDFITAPALVRAGMGIAFIPESFWSGNLPGLRLFRLPQKSAAWSVGAVWRRRDGNPALRRGLQLLRDLRRRN